MRLAYRKSCRQLPSEMSNDSNEENRIRRRRPTLTLFTLPALIRAHIVVLPTPTSLQAVFTETAKGLLESGILLKLALGPLDRTRTLPRKPTSQGGSSRTNVGVLKRCRYLSFVAICRGFRPK